MKSIDNLSQILFKSRKIPVNKNDRFWMDALDYLGMAAKRGDAPDFLRSWIKEVLTTLREENKINLYFVMPEDGCWGIYIADKGNYLFSHNEGVNIYISHRLYKYLKENKAHDLLAGLLLHEAAEFIMRSRADKKGAVVDINKNHGEALRLEKALLGRGNKGETLLQDALIDLSCLEIERKRVALDKNDIYVEGCEINGEEIIVEISSIKQPDESFIIQLAPGQRKTLPYSGGSFTIKAEEFKGAAKTDMIDFNNYCDLMKIMDNFFIEESVIHEEGPFKDIMSYIRQLDYLDEKDNMMLEMLWVFVQRHLNTNISRHNFIYNLFLRIDERVSYFVILDAIKNKYWKEGRYVKDNIKDIVDEAYEKKIKKLPEILCVERTNKGLMKEWAAGWFSKMGAIPLFLSIDKAETEKDIPEYLKKYYKKDSAKSLIAERPKNINTELLIHEGALKILHKINSLMNEARSYYAVKRGEDRRVCELNMTRIHFWEGRSVFNKGGKARVYNKNNEGCGIAEIIDVKESSIIIFLQDAEIEIPGNGYVKKLEEDDASLDVSLAAIQSLKKVKGLYEKIFKGEGCEGSVGQDQAISFFNPLIGEDNSQSNAVREAIFNKNTTVIQGPPGTGKTTVIAEIILQCLKMGKKVLLSSQTNNAVDNALKEVIKWKYIDMGAGRVTSKEEKLQDSQIKDVWIKSDRELEIFEAKYKNGYVIGATNVGTNTLNVMKGREFDALIMDEAGKANLLESLLPMLLIKENGKFVIVGDHKQGTPFAYDDDIVDLFIKKEVEVHKGLFIDEKEESFLIQRLNQSLFERLIETGRQSILLKVNYRSPPAIVELVGKLFYNNELAAFRKPLDKGKNIIVVDTSKRQDSAVRRETEIIQQGRGRGYKNVYEAELIVEELKESLRYKYIAAGIRGRRITGVTILAPYIFQVEEIRKKISFGLKNRLPDSALDDIVENVSTIDSFQGREDDIIIISFTRSNDNPREVGFLRELNRINVALSRAKRKMVLIGDFETLMNVGKGLNASSIKEIFRAIYNYR